MSTEDIRRAKADLLLECQELESKVFGLQREARYFAGGLEQFARVMAPPDKTGEKGFTAVSPIDTGSIEKMQAALDYAKATQIANNLNAALAALAEVNQKKMEFGLR